LGGVGSSPAKKLSQFYMILRFGAETHLQHGAGFISARPRGAAVTPPVRQAASTTALLSAGPNYLRRSCLLQFVVDMLSKMLQNESFWRFIQSGASKLRSHTAVQQA
jgi:hypothetical protein